MGAPFLAVALRSPKFVFYNPAAELRLQAQQQPVGAEMRGPQHQRVGAEMRGRKHQPVGVEMREHRHQPVVSPPSAEMQLKHQPVGAEMRGRKHQRVFGAEMTGPYHQTLGAEMSPPSAEMRPPSAEMRGRKHQRVGAEMTGHRHQLGYKLGLVDDLLIPMTTTRKRCWRHLHTAEDRIPWKGRIVYN